MTPRSVVESSPEILVGEPVFAGTRVPVRNLIDYLEHGGNLDARPVMPRLADGATTDVSAETLNQDLTIERVWS